MNNKILLIGLALIVQNISFDASAFSNPDIELDEDSKTLNQATEQQEATTRKSLEFDQGADFYKLKTGFDKGLSDINDKERRLKALKESLQRRLDLQNKETAKTVAGEESYFRDSIIDQELDRMKIVADRENAYVAQRIYLQRNAPDKKSEFSTEDFNNISRSNSQSSFNSSNSSAGSDGKGRKRQQPRYMQLTESRSGQGKPEESNVINLGRRSQKKQNKLN